MFQAVNIHTQKPLATHLKKAVTFWERSRGLLAHTDLREGHGLWIDPCKSIHTFFMKFPIDVIFIDGDYVVRGIEKNILPNRLSWIYLRARSVIELPSHTIEATQTELGHRLRIEGTP